MWTSSSTSSVWQTAANAKIMTLSGGQRRRLDVAIGIVGRPEIVFFDEPTAGFDPHARRDFHDLVHRLSDFENTTILMTTHDLDEAEKIADRILVLDEGRIVADGSADQLARELTTAAEVRWTSGGRRHVHAVREGDPSDFVRDLLVKNADVTELEVRRASLEDTYMALVQRAESGQSRSGGTPDETTAKTPRGAGMTTTTALDARWAAVRAGLSRGWIETRQSLTETVSSSVTCSRQWRMLAVLLVHAWEDRARHGLRPWRDGAAEPPGHDDRLRRAHGTGREPSPPTAKTARCCAPKPPRMGCSVTSSARS